METDLVLIWKKCRAIDWEEMMPKHAISKTGIRVDQVIIEKTLKLPKLILVQQTQYLPGHQKNYENIVSP